MALAESGYRRDGQTNKKPINYGLLLDPAGPSALNCFPAIRRIRPRWGRALEKLREPYGRSKVTLGDDQGRLPPPGFGTRGSLLDATGSRPCGR